jgi:putative tryptophan/tyrosine transport system substrate-binding protein
MSAPASVGLRRRLMLRRFVAAALSAPIPSFAAPLYDLRVLAGPPTQSRADALAALRDRFGPLPFDEDPQRLRRLSRPMRPTAYLALGAAALQAVLTIRLDAPVVSLFASRSAFQRIVGSGEPETPATAIFAEPAPDQQMRLIASLYKRPVSVGVLLTPQTAMLQPVLQQAASDNGLLLRTVHAEPGMALTRSLNLLRSATVVLIQPDGALYTPASLRELLESTYRRRQPVIGFSAGLVTAGTLASAYSSIDDTVAQLGSVLDEIVSGRLPAPRYPAYWRVAVNDNVARSLDVVVDNETRRLGVRP